MMAQATQPTSVTPLRVFLAVFFVAGIALTSACSRRPDAPSTSVVDAAVHRAVDHDWTGERRRELRNLCENAELRTYSHYQVKDPPSQDDLMSGDEVSANIAGLRILDVADVTHLEELDEYRSEANIELTVSCTFNGHREESLIALITYRMIREEGEWRIDGSQMCPYSHDSGSIGLRDTCVTPQFFAWYDGNPRFPKTHSGSGPSLYDCTQGIYRDSLDPSIQSACLEVLQPPTPKALPRITR